jgi:mono/diheme cytochrome c family protein
MQMNRIATRFASFTLALAAALLVAMHGASAQGSPSAAATAPHPPPWSVVSSYVRRPAGDMPSFSVKILPDATLADIYAYLMSIPAGKPSSQIPLLNSTLTPK